MSKQKAPHILIYKLHSTRLSDAKWQLNLPLEEAISNGTDVVELNDSQLIRFLDRLNNIDVDGRIAELKAKISELKKQKRSKEKIRQLYSELYATQFRADYVCIIMDSMKHYDRCNKGFSINGIKYRRLLGTNNGIKKSTIIYINADKYDRLYEMINCGRDMTKKFVPAKLEAYQALVCSGSIPVSMPKGIIVVPDCVTHFKDDGLYVDDTETREPEVTYIKDRGIEMNASDGFGLMLPSVSKRWSDELNHRPDDHIPAVNVRGIPFTKGMLFTFDFVKFAEEVAHTYIIKDAWGNEQDVRNAEVILTTSMLKLWDSYKSWDDYESNFKRWGYEFAIAKTAPYECDEERTTNYQFLQSYELTDDEIHELVSPTIDVIKDVAGGDYRKALLYLGGFGLKPESVAWRDAGIPQALMTEPDLINDRYVRSVINEAIKTRIKRAKIGVLDVRGNFSIIGGDPYSLAQSMFGLEVTGLLKRGEIYHKFWSDKNVSEVCCFRAPMTSHNNICKQQVANSYNSDKFYEMSEWYKHITSCVLFNSWDTTAERLNGCDFDGDLCFTTDNAVLIKNTHTLPTVFCVQRQAEKKIPLEQDFIKTNKLSFGDAIGSTTNIITSQICKLAKFEPDSEEYKTLSYRVLCGQLYQQCCIDKAKGIISKPMPASWKSLHAVKDDEFQKRIVADKKPYFFIYNYEKLYTRYVKFMKAVRESYQCEYGSDFDADYHNKRNDEDKRVFFDFYEKLSPVDDTPCTMNRICHMVENETKDIRLINKDNAYDINRLKSPVPSYSKDEYYRAKEKISDAYEKYLTDMKELNYKLNNEYVHGADRGAIIEEFTSSFEMSLKLISDDSELVCDILIDIAYKNKPSMRFVWETCGKQIVLNLLKRNNGTISYPIRSDSPEFLYHGTGFRMETVQAEVIEA